MASKKEIEQHLKIALDEVGKIEPWYDKSVRAWVFGHPSYPVEYAGSSRADVIKGYPLYLREFIKQRLNHNLAPFIEKKTKGHGGKRIGSGRPKGTKKESKKRLYLPTDVVNWFQQHPSQSISTVRRFIARGK
jgi:hypothetical protein